MKNFGQGFIYKSKVFPPSGIFTFCFKCASGNLRNTLISIDT